MNVFSYLWFKENFLQGVAIRLVSLTYKKHVSISYKAVSLTVVSLTYVDM
jgi:hypothetical protein